MPAFYLSLCLLLISDVLGDETCGINPHYISGRIIGGYVASPCSFPWHAHIHFVDNNTVDGIDQQLHFEDTFRCGSVIIDENHVLISPSCMLKARNPMTFCPPRNSRNTDDVLKQMVVVAGDYDQATYPEKDATGAIREQVRLPSQLFFPDFYPYRDQDSLVNAQDPLHGDYRATRDFQCGLVKLRTPLEFNTCVTNICLGTPADSECNQEACIHAGNGLINTTFRPFQRSPKLHLTRMTALTEKACKVLEVDGHTLPVKMGFCAHPIVRSRAYPCVNDHGGALACFRNGRWYLRGTSVLDKCEKAKASSFADMTGICKDYIEAVISGSAVPTATLNP